MTGRMSYLGEFEQVVLLAVARLKSDAYGMGLRAEIAERFGRASSIGAIYATLDRLVAKGYLTQRDDDMRGRARRFFTLTSSGVEALETARTLQRRMWTGVQLPKGAKR
jgi:PadR family transcriptional regulator, regulatory protein PadR